MTAEPPQTPRRARRSGGGSGTLAVVTTTKTLLAQILGVVLAFPGGLAVVVTHQRCA
jgi:hypothetical protein